MLIRKLSLATLDITGMHLYGPKTEFEEYQNFLQVWDSIMTSIYRVKVKNLNNLNFNTG